MREHIGVAELDDVQADQRKIPLVKVADQIDPQEP
jgi:hypothetical protein